MMNTLLSLLRCTSRIIEIRYLMTWFVAMPIPSLVKHIIQTGNHRIIALSRLAVADYLKQSFLTREGKPYRLLALPLPDAIYDEDGERLPATYANYLVMNSAVLYPTYNQPEKDRAAKAIIQKAFPTHEIVGIDCTALIVQHGSLHCATMQFPQGVLPAKG